MTKTTVRIGPGLYAQTLRPEKSLMQQYLAKQLLCEHRSIDPRGDCYACGKKVNANKEALRG